MKCIVVPGSKRELEDYLDGVCEEIQREEIYLDKNEFDLLWTSDILNLFFDDTGILIDDYETTIVDNISDIITFRKHLKKRSWLTPSLNKLKAKLLLCANSALAKESGILFLF